jgi:cytoskeletal protein CcmA (bactofilin family)
MATQVQFRRGSTAQNDAFTGAIGELSIDTDLDLIRVHDGSTPGGFSMVGVTNTQTLLNKTLGNTTITGNSVINSTANISGANIAATGTLTATGNISGANIAATGTLTATGNITGANLILTGIVSVNSSNAAQAITNAAGNGVGNIGSSSTYFNTVFAKATSAQYADLAEMYVSDAIYQPGTVVSFGGTYDVTRTETSGDVRVAGVVSTAPSYLMNTEQQGEFVLPIALTGKVPTQVTGTIHKGDMMISAGNGIAMACAAPSVGMVIGKSLEEFSGESGVINIVVGRL